MKTQQISKQETSLNNKAKHSEQNPNHRQNYFILRTQSLSRNNQFYHDKKPNLPLKQPMLPQKQQEIPKSKSYRQTNEEPRYGRTWEKPNPDTTAKRTGSQCNNIKQATTHSCTKTSTSGTNRLVLQNKSLTHNFKARPPNRTTQRSKKKQHKETVLMPDLF